MAKRLVITLSFEDEDNWRNGTEVRRILMPREYESLRMGPRNYVVEEAGRMFDQLQAAEEKRHG